MPFSRQRNDTEANMSAESGQRAHAVNASSRASLHSSHVDERRQTSSNLVNSASTASNDSFLAIDHDEKGLGGLGVEVTYPSMVHHHESHPWKEFEESQSYNKRMISTPNTEPTAESDDDSFFPYLGRSPSAMTPPRGGNGSVPPVPPSPADDFDSIGCFDSTFPYLGRRSTPVFHSQTARDDRFKRIDPDGQLARHLCFDNLASVNRSPVQSGSPETAPDGNQDEHKSASIIDSYTEHRSPCRGPQSDVSDTSDGQSTVADAKDDSDGLPIEAEQAGCTATFFPYLGRLYSLAKDESSYNDECIPKDMWVPSSSNNYSDGWAPAIPFLCQGAAPLSPASLLEETKVDDADVENDTSLPRCLVRAAIGDQEPDEDEFNYSVSSVESRSSRSKEASHGCSTFPYQQKEPANINCKPSIRTGRAYLELGMAYLESGKDLPAAKCTFELAYASLEHKPVAQALALEKMSQIAIMQAREDASLLSQAHILLLESYRLRQEHLGKLHVDTVDTLNQLAMYHRRSGNLQESRRLQAQVYRARKQIFGRLHPSCAVAAHDLANVLAQLGQLKDAQHFYHVALTTYEQVHVPLGNPAVARLVRDVQQVERVQKGGMTPSIKEPYPPSAGVRIRTGATTNRR